VGVSEAANFNKEELKTGQIKAKESGVLYVYLSNERKDGKPMYPPILFSKGGITFL